MILSCALDAIRLGNLLQLALTSELRARLEVKAPHTLGWIGIVGGRIHGAASGPLEGKEATLELLLLKEGRCDARPFAGAPPPPLPEDPFALLMESLRLEDHWGNLRDRRLTLKRGARIAPSPLVAQLGRGLSLEAAARAGGVPITRALAEAEALIQAGSLTLGARIEGPGEDAGPPPAEAHPPPGGEGFFECMDGGLEAWRRGDLATAEAQFRAACAARPDARAAQYNLRRVAAALGARDAQSGGIG